MPTKRDKVWQAEVSYKHHGTFKKWRKSGFKTKKEALIAESEFKLNIQKYLQKKYTLYEWFETWAEIYKKPSVSIRTYQKYINILVNIKKYFGDVRLDKIKNLLFGSHLKMRMQELASVLFESHVLCNSLLSLDAADHRSLFEKF